MALQRRSDRGQLVNPSGAGPRPTLKVRRGPDGKLEVEDPAERRPDEPDDPRPAPDPPTPRS